MHRERERERDGRPWWLAHTSLFAKILDAGGETSPPGCKWRHEAALGRGAHRALELVYSHTRSLSLDSRLDPWNKHAPRAVLSAVERRIKQTG